MPQENRLQPSAGELSIAAAEFTSLLRAQGLHAALRFLNSRTRHRFTGVYRIAPQTLHNVCLYDRENPSLRVGTETPLEETYCSITGQMRTPFTFEDSSKDPRFRANPVRSTVISYCGVPLQMGDGTSWGTLCHFDLRPRIVPTAEIPLMEQLAPVVLESVLKPKIQDDY